MCFFHRQFALNKGHHPKHARCQILSVVTDVVQEGMESEEYAGVEPRTLTKLYRMNRLSAVSVDRWTVKIDLFRERNSVLFRATKSIQRSLLFGAAVVCFPMTPPARSSRSRRHPSALRRPRKTGGR